MRARTLASCWIAVIVALFAGLAATAATAATAPKLPKSIQSIDRQLAKAAKPLGKRQTARLRGPLRAAGRAIRAHHSCTAAKALTTIVTRAGRLRGARARAAAPVAASARRLNRRLVFSQRRHGACGLRITVRVKPSLRPAIAALPPVPGAAKRPVFRIQGTHATTDFAERELLFNTSGMAGLAGLLKRSGGRLVSSSSPPDPKTKYATTDLIALPAGAKHLSASRRAELIADLRQEDPLARGSLAASSAAGLDALAIVADERARGLHVGLNPVLTPDVSDLDLAFPGERFLDGQSLEDPSATGPQVNNSRNAFDWPWFTNVGPNAYGVANAWRQLEMAGKLIAGSVRIAIIDQGFVSGADLPAATTGAGGPTGSSAAPTHGYFVAQAAAGVADNGIGAAGPAGPIADLRLVFHDYDGAGTAARISAAIGTGARIINMSFHEKEDAIVSFASNNTDDMIEEALAHNILPIASAGNDGVDVDAEDCYIACWEQVHYSPCEADGVLCVGGVDATRINRDPSSNYGRDSCNSDDCDVKLFGPFTLAVYGANANGVLTNKPQLVAGTSFSTPFVAGVAALVLAVNPSLRPNDLRSTLLSTANPSADPSVPRVVDAEAAVLSVLGDQPPLVGIVRPRETAAYTGQPERFDGIALNAGPVTCCKFAWSTFAGGMLGLGSSINASLPASISHVTLEATNGEGLKGSTSVDVNRQPKFVSDTQLTVHCPSPVAPGSVATISGTLTGAGAGSGVSIELADPDGANVTLNATSGTAGYYSVTTTPSAVGTYRVVARFAADPSHNGSTAICAFVVAVPGPGPIPTATSLQCPPPPASFLQFGVDVALAGNINPSPVSSSNTMYLSFVAPDGTQTFGTAVIGADGGFQYSFASNADIGRWYVTAVFDGTDAFAASESNYCTFHIVPHPK
ncbi:MAG: hypothetical protein QOE31_1913 [Solirubrobacteraceae bacterium]|nr:hypothetical protein [Solirubrobacteraceae bacterium]